MTGIYRKKSKPGEINLNLSDLKPTQYQLYLDKIFNPKNQEGIPGMMLTVLGGKLIIPPPKEDPLGLINRRQGKLFSDLARLIILKDDSSIYVMAGAHRLASITIANLLYKTRDYLDAKEYDLASIDNLQELNRWRINEFVLQRVKENNIGKHYKGFNIKKYQKGFNNQYTAECGGKRVFIKRCVFSWEELIFQNAPSIVKRFKYLLSKNLIRNKKDILITKDINSFFKKRPL